MFQQYQEVPAFVLISTLDDEQVADVSVVKQGAAEQKLEDGPGIALIAPGTPYQEMISFSDVDVVPWNETVTLLNVTRGVMGGPFHHQPNCEVYIDQGEQYLRLSENSKKEMLKRWLRTLTR